jgi:HSP20 family protein
MTGTKDAPMKTRTTAPPTASNAAKAPAPAPAAPPAVGFRPFAQFRRFAEEMDRLLESYGFGAGFSLPSVLTRGHELLRRETGLVPAEWSPRVDVAERDGRMVIRADLPGMTPADVQVEIGEDQVVLRGERKQAREEEVEGRHYSECTYGRFYRAIPLPDDADTEKAKATFRNGVLEVTVPVPPSAEFKMRRLTIEEAK